MPTEIIDPPIAHIAKPRDGKASQVGAKRSKSKPVAATAPEEESHGNDEPSVSSATDDDSQKEVTTPSRGGDEESASKADTGTPSTAADTWETPAKKKKPPTPKKGRSPAVKGLSIPFRTVKKAMKLDPDIPIVQNEAAIMTTLAAELFLRSLAKESHQIAKNRGRNTIRYEDLAEARSNDPALSFLATLIP